MIKVGILGYGGIARSHRIGYEILAKEGAPVELVALCDIDPNQFDGAVTTNIQRDAEKVSEKYHTYTSLDEMLAKEQLDTVDICLPSYLHAEYACKLLKAGYNVQSEKPMARTYAQCKEILEVLKDSQKQMMIGMCLRFEPLYIELKKMVDSGIYGKVESAHFDRLSALPRWGFEGWYHNYEKAGGAALDLHIHDVDMIRWLFGEPERVSASTSDCKVRCTTINSQFYYPDKLVSAYADWGRAAGSQFEMNYRVNFEKATVVMQHETITVYPAGEPSFVQEFTPYERMAGEIGYFARCCDAGKPVEENRPQDAALTVRLVEKLMESAEHGSIPVKVED